MSGISIIIPTYNHQALLDEALAAIAVQTSAPDEIIVINDGSQDDTKGVLARWQTKLPNLSAIHNETNLGIEESMKRALAHSTQPFFMSLGDDDPISPDAVEKLKELLQLNPNVGYVCCEYDFLMEDGSTHPCSTNFSETPKNLSREDLLMGMVRFEQISFPTSSSLWRKSALLEVGGYRPELKWHCDWFAAWAIIFRYGLSYRNDRIQTIRRNSNSYSERGQRDPAQQAQVMRALMETLELPDFDDIRDLFKIPSVLSRFGSPLLRTIISDERFYHYLSDRLMQNVFAVMGYTYSDKEMTSLMQSLRASACSMLLDSLEQPR